MSKKLYFKILSAVVIAESFLASLEDSIEIERERGLFE